MAKQPTTQVKFSVRIPEPLYDAFVQRAKQHGVDVESEISEHLSRTAQYTASNPIYLTDAQRNELSQLAGVLLRNADDLVAWAKRITSLHVDSVDIPLSQQLVTRLESRRFGKSWPDLMRSMVTEGLEQAVGLR